MDFARIGTNTGHGHAWPRPDGVKARCGGPGICRECAVDAAMVERWRKHSGDDGGAAHGPIDPTQTELMNGLARTLDEIFNGVGTKEEDKKVGFFLTTFNFDAPGRFNYISNANKLDVRAMLREIGARIDARLSTEGRA